MTKTQIEKNIDFVLGNFKVIEDALGKLRDAEVEGISNCCGAKVYQPDICSDCKEHCDTE